MRPTWTIRQRLLVLLLGAVLPLLVALGFTLHRVWSASRAHVERTGLRVARDVAGSLEHVVDEAGGALNVLATRSGAAGKGSCDSPACRMPLGDVLALQPELANILIVDREARVIAAARRRDTDSSRGLADADALRAVMASGRRGVSGPIRGPLAGGWVAGIAEPVRDRDGRVVGAATVALSLDSCQRIVEENTPDNVTTTVLDAGGRVLARAPGPGEWIGRDARGVEIVDSVLAGSEGTLIARGIGGAERVYGFTGVPGTPWKVYAGVRTTAAFAPLWAAVRATAVAILLTLLVAAAAAYALGRGIDRPVRALASAIGRVGAAGDPVRVPVSGPPELVRVAEAVNAMLDSRDAAARERERLREEVRRGEAMAAMGALVGTVAHEVRNPLFGITSTLDAFEARLGDCEECRPYVAGLRAESERLNRLMSDLLAYGGASAAADESPATPAAAALAASLELCEPAAARRDVRLRHEAADGVPAVAIGHDLLVMVLRNLLENAVQHSHPGGEVVACCKARRHRDVAGVEWTVTDSGPGFPPDVLDAAFAPFHGHRAGGTGLGLAIASRTVMDHGGTMAAANRMEGGAAVRFWLPAAAPGGRPGETV